MITRRHLLLGTALTTAALVAAGGWHLFSTPALAQAEDSKVTAAELLAPGTLPDQVQGDEKAPVTLVEYASMTCSHCAHFHSTTYPDLKKRYIDTGKVRYIFREFPLDPLAAAGSMLARAAGDGRYFAMVDALFSQQRQWAVRNPLPPLLGIAKQAGFSQQQFEATLSNQKMLDEIEAGRTRAADKFGVTSTPTFFVVGQIDGASVVKMQRGAISAEDLDKLFAPYLKS